MIYIWMVCPLLMAVKALKNISGHLLVPVEKLQKDLVSAFVTIGCVTAVTVTPGHTTHHLLETTISVTLAMRASLCFIDSTPRTPCGMVLGVVPQAPVVNSTTLPGSARPSPSPLLMTWRSLTATKTLELTHPFS